MTSSEKTTVYYCMSPCLRDLIDMTGAQSVQFLLSLGTMNNAKSLEKENGLGSLLQYNV